MSKHTNALINSSSPYLLQHAHNPVNWVEWSEEAFQKAENENKLVLVSIGYSSCHWCHVMERECFENEAVAQLMNTHFVCIKVDREERPDIDQIYMLAVQMMTQRGGWPLNCFCLPDGNPIYGGTYFPKDQWTYILENLNNGYQNDKEKFIDYAIKLKIGIQQVDLIPQLPSLSDFTNSKLQELVGNWRAMFDNKNGGNNRAPKFPMPNNFLFLLRYAITTNDNKLKDYVQLSLQKMARGGIYDQIGGGFARYSTDMLWKVPHFEKMLYDNAQLISLYATAYQVYQLDEFKAVVEETYSWLEREMKSDFGSFYTAIDADSDGKEGLFYTWSAEALEAILGKDYEWFSKYYNVNEKGYWHEEQIYILLRSQSVDEFAKQHKLTAKEFKAQLKAAQQKLLKARNKRVKPEIDDKSLCSWNALLITGFCDAYKVFGDEKYFNQALQIAQWVEQYLLQKNGELLHTFKSGKASVKGFLEDYATVIEAWLNLYSVTFDENWVLKAHKLIVFSIKHFGDKKSGLFFFTDKNTKLIMRKIVLDDGVIPSPNSIMAKNLFKLGHLLGKSEYLEKAREMLNYVYGNMHEFGTSYSNWADLLMNFTKEHYEIVIIGEKFKIYVSALRKHYTPNITMIASLSENQLELTKNRAKQGETLIYVCQDQSCQQPTTDIEKVLELVQKCNN